MIKILVLLVCVLPCCAALARTGPKPASEPLVDGTVRGWNFHEDFYNLADPPDGNLPMRMNGSDNDLPRLQAIYDSAPPDASLTAPANGRLPVGMRSTRPPALGSVEFNLLGDNYLGATGTNIINEAIGDNDLTHIFTGGHESWFRSILSASPQSPSLVMQLDEFSHDYQMTGYGGLPQVPNLFLYSTSHPGSDADMVVLQSTLQSMSTHPYTEDDVSIQSTVSKQGSSSTWEYVGDSSDVTGKAPQSFAQVGAELDIQADGPDLMTTDFAPGDAYGGLASNRTFIDLVPIANAFKKWTAGMTAKSADGKGAATVIEALGPDGVLSTYYAIKAGTAATSKPNWPGGGGVVEDGTISWAYGEPYAMTVGNGIWLDPGSSSTTARSASFGTGFGTGSRFQNAVIDTSEAKLINPWSAAIRIGADQSIDFTGGGAKAAGFFKLGDTDAPGKAAAADNQHTLSYQSALGALTYMVHRSSVVAIDNNGNLKVRGSITSLNGVSTLGGLTEVATTAGGTISGSIGPFPTIGLSFGWNETNRDREADMVVSTGGLNVYGVNEHGAIGKPLLKLTNTGVLTANALANSVDPFVVAAGATQVTGRPLTAQDSVIITCAVGQGVVLPPAIVGEKFRVLNRAGGTCKIYPPKGGMIENNPINEPISIAAGQDVMVEPFTEERWYE